MKRFFSFLILVIATSQTLFAQTNNLILFTENGEQFQVVLNGILQNAKAETNVKLTQLPAPNYKCRVIFADKKLGQLDFNVYFNETEEELTMSIKKNKNGEYVTRYVSAIPVVNAPASPVGQTTIIYTTVAPPVETVTTTVSQTTTTHSHTDSSPDNVSIHMGMHVDNDDANIVIQTGGMNIDGDLNATSSSTTTTTTTHSVTTTTKAPVLVVPANNADGQTYNGPIGCPNPMDKADFEQMKETIAAKDFESTRLSIAKQALQQNCLLAGQVNEILSLFDFENTKLEFAKYAYAYTFDTGNYFKVNDSFEFESSVQDLNNFISAKN